MVHKRVAHLAQGAMLHSHQVIYLVYLLFTLSFQKHQAKNILFMRSGPKMKQLGH